LEYGQITQAKERLAEQKFYLENEIRLEHNFEEIIGNSPRLKAVLDSVRIVAPANSTVLIQGETGTGKEVIARAVHNLSYRSQRPARHAMRSSGRLLTGPGREQDANLHTRFYRERRIYSRGLLFDGGVAWWFYLPYRQALDGQCLGHTPVRSGR